MYSTSTSVTLQIYNTLPNFIRLFVLKAALNNQTIHGKYLDSCLYVLSYFIKQINSRAENKI